MRYFKECEQYRTWSVAVLSILALVYAAVNGVKGEDLVAVKWGLVGIVGLVAGRAIGIAASGGPGIKGLISNVFTDSKPPAGNPEVG